MILITVFLGILLLAGIAMGVFVWLHGPSRAILSRVLARFKFSLRTLLLATLAIGALGSVWFRWNPFTPIGQSLTTDGLQIAQSTIEFSPDGQRLLFLKASGVWLWDFKADPAPIKIKPALDYANGARFSSDGAAVIAFNPEKIVRINLADLAQTAIADFTVQPKLGEDVFQSVRVMTVANNAKYALVEESASVRTASGGIGTLSDKPRFIQIRDCADGKVLASFPSDSWASNVAGISADGRRVCWFPSNSGYTGLTMFDLGTQQVTDLRPESLHVFQGRLTITNGRGKTAYACLDNSVEVVDLERMRVLEHIGIPSVQAAFLSPDGSRLATVHDLKSIQIWEARRELGGYGPLDFPELWLSAVFVALFLASWIGDLFGLRRARLPASSAGGVASPAPAPNTPANLSPKGAE